jgi:hypothetical protein
MLSVKFFYTLKMYNYYINFYISNLIIKFLNIFNKNFFVLKKLLEIYCSKIEYFKIKYFTT